MQINHFALFFCFVLFFFFFLFFVFFFFFFSFFGLLFNLKEETPGPKDVKSYSLVVGFAISAFHTARNENGEEPFSQLVPGHEDRRKSYFRRFQTVQPA